MQRLAKHSLPIHLEDLVFNLKTLSTETNFYIHACNSMWLVMYYTDYTIVYVLILQNEFLLICNCVMLVCVSLGPGCIFTPIC